jgi:hypothetical protein
VVVCSEQGLGKGPARVLTGTWSSRAKIGSMCLLDSRRKGVSFAKFQGPVAALAATDQIVIAGFRNGRIEIMHMNNPLQ